MEKKFTLKDIAEMCNVGEGAILAFIKYRIETGQSVPNPIRLHKERLKPIDGQPPDLLKPPSGCPFFQRCSYSMEVCKEYMPKLYDINDGHKSACWLNDPKAPKVESPITREVL